MLGCLHDDVMVAVAFCSIQERRMAPYDVPLESAQANPRTTGKHPIGSYGERRSGDERITNEVDEEKSHTLTAAIPFIAGIAQASRIPRGSGLRCHRSIRTAGGVSEDSRRPLITRVGQTGYHDNLSGRNSEKRSS
jgi:hypothetical protein